MPRFLIKRVWGAVDEAVMAENGRRSVQIQDERFRDIVWEHSHVAVDSDGRVVSFCVYEAPDVDRLREHSRAVGGHFIDEVLEIAGDVTPEDFEADREDDAPKPAQSRHGGH
jgi:hypothetical protein